MNGGHDTALNGSVIVKSLCHRSKAVGGAGCSRDNLVICGEVLLVYAVNDGLEVVACGSRDNNLLCACVDVSHGLLLGAVEAGALKNNVNAKLAPRAVSSVLLSVDFKNLAINGDGISLVISNNGVTVITTLSGVVLEKMSEHRSLGKIVDSYDIVALCAEHLSESKTSDTAEAVNCNLYICHWCNPPKYNIFLITNSIGTLYQRSLYHKIFKYTIGLPKIYQFCT